MIEEMRGEMIEGKKEEMIEGKEEMMIEQIIEETNEYLITEDIKENMEEIKEELLGLNFSFITIGIFRCHRQWSIYQ